MSSFEDMKYTEILARNASMEGQLNAEPYNVSILSNIMLAQMKDFLEFCLRCEGINARVKFGDYDNIVQDSFRGEGFNLVIIFWELCNIVDGLQYKFGTYTESDYEDLLSMVKSEIDTVFRNLSGTSLVLMNTFSSLAFSASLVESCKLDVFARELNAYIEEKRPGNFKIVDVDKVVAKDGIDASFDFRYYYLSKTLYTLDFYKNYTQYIKPFTMAANGRAKKALIFDCDNTLWKGVIGEEGMDGIEMGLDTRDGALFYEVQYLAKSMASSGVLIGLCSKNNPTDVDGVICNHPDMLLNDEVLTVKKINWGNKVENLLEISKELNIGLDSIVFVDDSSFEINLVREQLPQVESVQVPQQLYEYPGLIREIGNFFYNLSSTGEDKKRVQMYKAQVEREKAIATFESFEDYLASLDLKVTVHEDDSEIIPRMAQMTQKTNQFNLTTKRYTEKDIQEFLYSNTSLVFAVSVADKFGDSGITGLSIVSLNGDKVYANIDTFLMSCRIIGRNIEYVIMDYLIERLKQLGLEEVKAFYLKTPKNAQVLDFYDKCSFSLTKEKGNSRDYILSIPNYKPKKIEYIEVINGR